MNARWVLDELPLPLPEADADLCALTVAMILESELGIRLTDAELNADTLGDRVRIAALLARHGVS